MMPIPRGTSALFLCAFKDQCSMIGLTDNGSLTSIPRSPNSGDLHVGMND
jgi:hypothetical protein